MNDMTEIFGEVISSYTREQAIEDGVLIDLWQPEFKEVCQNHFKYPVAVTQAVFEIIRKAVENPNYSNDYKGIIHDMLWMLRYYIKRSTNQQEVLFKVIITGAGEGNKKYFTFKSVIGPGDNMEPVITIMLPNED